jgi:hypothetical protein
MPITFTCRCGNVLRTADTNAGKPGKCPACSTPFIVPHADGRAIPAPQADVSDYPLRRATRQPVRDRGSFDGLTADDVQLRPRLDEEDEEQKEARRHHRMPHSALDEYGDGHADQGPSRTRPMVLMAVGVLLMFGGGVWFRVKIESGVIVLQAPLVFLAGLMLALVGALGYFRWSASRPK